MGDNLRWGIVGTGKIARILATAIEASADGELVAVGSRIVERAASFAAEFGAARHGTYDDVIGGDDVDLVYVAAHHPAHRSLAVAAADAGKHVLCEKPIAVTERDASAIVDAARRSGVFLLEAFAYRTHPQTGRLIEIVGSGRIGEVRTVEATFGYDAGPTPKNYLLVHELAGGAILDVGCYTTSMSHLVASTVAGVRAVDAADVEGSAEIGPSGVDLSAQATLTFRDGPVATVACSIREDLANAVIVEGSEGRVAVPSPWLPGRIGTDARIVIEPAGGEPETVHIPIDADVYAIEVDAVHRSIRDGERSTAMMPWEDSLANMRTLDRWRATIGLRFADDETPEPGG